MSTITRFIIIALALVASLYVLWPTYRYYQLEGERAPLKARLEDTARKATGKDSTAFAAWEKSNGEAYKSAGENRIKLGLDLRGGMYLTLEVDVPTLLQESAQRDNVDDVFLKVIAETRKESVGTDDPVLDIFKKHFDAIARPAGKTLLTYFDVGSLGADPSDKAILEKLQHNVDDAVLQAEQVVRNRIDKYGVSEVTITKQAGRRLVLELPGESDEGSIRSLLQTTARLEFKLVKNGSEGPKLFRKIDDMLAGKNVVSKTDSTKAAKPDSTKAGKPDSTKAAKPDSTKAGKPDSTKAGKPDSTKRPGDTSGKKPGDTSAKNQTDTSDPYKGLTDEQKLAKYRKEHPFGSLFVIQVQANEETAPQYMDMTIKEIPEGADIKYYYSIPYNKIAELKALLARPDVKAIMPEDIIVAFGTSSDGGENNAKKDENTLYPMYLLTRDAELTGDVVTQASPDVDQFGKTVVRMEMNADGADRWAGITGRNIKKNIAIVLDSAVYSAPVVQGKIPNGSSQITVGGSGDKTAAFREANLLSTVLKAGALKAPVKIIEERIVGPSLGEDSINEGITATLIAAMLVIVFMLVYYNFGGLVADVAVLFNVMITLALLAVMHATLTLPGIGGLVLTIGMAVDGNVLIYERTREEQMAGKSLSQAVKLGYSKAFAAIIDTHITTFLTGAILYLLGTGPIKGFAVTLMIGIAATLFTAVFCTKTVFLWMLDRGATNINFGLPKKAYPVATNT